jgi:RNA polymerase sigma-70 factor (ECF subfamily)
MDQESERALVSGLAAGDPAAFDAIHAAFNARLFSFLLRLTRRRDVAEDLLEEAWLRLVAHASRLRPDTSLASWLFAVARNLYISYQRARMIENTHNASLIGLWPCGLSESSPFEETAANEMERRIEAALISLPSTYREVLLLVGVEGFRPSEAARICGVTPEAFRQRLSRARAMLTDRLDSPVRSKMTTFGEVTP